MTPARHFIDERLAEAWKEIDADFLLWTSRKKHPNLEFSGSIAEQFWGKSLKSYAATLTDTAFRAAREIAEDHKLDAAECAQTAGDAVENALHRLITTMVRIDRLMRGKGFPDSISERDGSYPLQECLKRLNAKTSAEVDAAKSRSTPLVRLPLDGDHGFWWFVRASSWSVRFWMLSSSTGLLLGAFLLGLGAARNNTFTKVWDALQSAGSTQPTTEPAKPNTTSTPTP
ncbi:MAG: hypothetical protein NTV46_00965 [Verrucomicrobia bacterium]|nr:hypothetical protein [Verrucomicrobiota bacterium]